MSAERDITRVVRSWLHEDGNENAERVLFAVVDQLDTTPQRPARWWRAWRAPRMSTNIRIAVAAAAVAGAALLGLTLLPRDVGNAPVASQSAGPTPTPQPMIAGELEPGTYRARSFSRLPFVITVPAGWSYESNFIGKGDPWEGNGVTFATWLVSHIYGDACQWEEGLVETGTAAEIVDALADQAGHEAAGPTETTVGGLAATRVELSVQADFNDAACDQGAMRLWPDAGPNPAFGLPINPGQTTTVFVVDTRSGPMLVVTVRNDDSSATDVAELEAILASMHFEP